MFKNSQKGFTLIELLVVIAIIGILAAMVITNLRLARLKARDASAITSLSSARAEAENHYDSAGLTYNGLCPQATPTPDNSDYNATNQNITPQTPFERLMVAAYRANLSQVNCNIDNPGQTYTVWQTLATPNTVPPIFCIDGTGFAGKVAAVANEGSNCQP